MNPASIAPGGMAPYSPDHPSRLLQSVHDVGLDGHLKYQSVALVTVVLVSWGIAFVEYCFAVPANRIGSAVYSPAELKTI